MRYLNHLKSGSMFKTDGHCQCVYELVDKLDTSCTLRVHAICNACVEANVKDAGNTFTYSTAEYLLVIELPMVAALKRLET